MIINLHIRNLKYQQDKITLRIYFMCFEFTVVDLNSKIGLKCWYFRYNVLDKF